MKFLAAVLATLALAAFATPALACGDKPTTAQGASKQPVAKQTAATKGAKASKAQPRPATAQN